MLWPVSGPRHKARPKVSKDGKDSKDNKDNKDIPVVAGLQTAPQAPIEGHQGRDRHCGCRWRGCYFWRIMSS